MIAVIFEVWPESGKKQNYLDLAAALRPILERIDGFISIERFESLNEPGKILSLSFSATRQPSPLGAKPKIIAARRQPGAAKSLPITGSGSLQ
jgi:hypothetical protein